MKTPGIRMFVLLILPTLWLATSHSADVSSPKIEEEILKQEEILQERGRKKPEGYVINRSLSDYTRRSIAGVRSRTGKPWSKRPMAGYWSRRGPSCIGLLQSKPRRGERGRHESDAAQKHEQSRYP